MRTFILEHIQGSRPAFSPDGASPAVPDFDGAVTVWDLRPSRWLDAPCSLAGRELTDGKWRQFIGTEEPHAICTR